MDVSFRWAIAGTGGIAGVFAENLKHVPGAELYAAVSRSRQKGQEFADRFGIQKVLSYDQLASSSDVDIVYIATPHPFHHELAIKCLEQNKAVLCEKPFTINSDLAAEVFQAARENETFVMEAMWTRFLPAVRQAKKIIDSSLIGEITQGHINFNFKGPGVPEHRILNPHLGGGALLDVGVYTISLAQYFFDEPVNEISSSADMSDTGVDKQAGMVLKFGKDKLAVLTCASCFEGSREAWFYGTKGKLWIGPQFYNSKRIIVFNEKNKIVEDISMSYEGNGLHFQAIEVHECIKAGKIESEKLSHKDTLEVLKIMDNIRHQWGLVYPME